MSLEEHFVVNIKITLRLYQFVTQGFSFVLNTFKFVSGTYQWIKLLAQGNIDESYLIISSV